MNNDFNESTNPKIIQFKSFIASVFKHNMTDKCSVDQLKAIEDPAKEELSHCPRTSEEDKEYEQFLLKTYLEAIGYVGFKDGDVYGWDGKKPPSW